MAEKTKPPKKWFSYGYFRKTHPNGQLVSAGHDFGETENTCKAGDSRGVKGDLEAFVINITKGAFAKKMVSSEPFHSD